MNLRLCIILFGYFFVNVSSQEERTILDELFLPKYRAIRTGLSKVLIRLNHDPKNIEELQRKQMVQKEFPKNARFFCNVNIAKNDKESPKSVHELRPSDIKVIGAIGDSLSAGNGLTATSFIGILLEDRGRSFPIGGEKTWRQYLTIPNILKEFNPDLIGYSLNTSQTIEWSSQFNVAEGGAVSKDIPYMSSVLIKRIKTDRRIDLEKDWKLITIFIGCNDFCAEFCHNDPKILLEYHRDDLLKTLRNLRDNLPNTIVNIIPPPNLDVLLNLNNKPPHCHTIHNFECPCLFRNRDQRKREFYNEMMVKWQQVDLEVADDKEFDLDNFTVVAQPFFVNYTFPETEDGNKDLSYLTYDCFHFSQKGQAKVALDYWNNIFEPVGKKSKDGSIFLKKFNCPTKNHPFIYTRRNSDL